MILLGNNRHRMCCTQYLVQYMYSNYLYLTLEEPLWQPFFGENIFESWCFINLVTIIIILQYINCRYTVLTLHLYFGRQQFTYMYKLYMFMLYCKLKKQNKICLQGKDCLKHLYSKSINTKMIIFCLKF